MKLINRREIGLVSALFFPILFSPPALANLISTDLVELGKEYYQAGDYSRAIHELSKALLADPADEEAKKYLNKMGLKDGVYHQDKTPIDKIADLSNEVVNYQQQLSDLEQANVQHLQAKEALEQQNASLQESASSQNTENEILRRKLDQAHDDIKIQGKQTQEELAAAAKTAEKKE